MKRDSIGLGAVMAEVVYLSSDEKTGVLMEDLINSLVNRFDFLSKKKVKETIIFAENCGVIDNNDGVIRLKNKKES
jgi:hypothetical protein